MGSCELPSGIEFGMPGQGNWESSSQAVPVFPGWHIGTRSLSIWLPGTELGSFSMQRRGREPFPVHYDFCLHSTFSVAHTQCSSIYIYTHDEQYMHARHISTHTTHIHHSVTHTSLTNTLIMLPIFFPSVVTFSLIASNLTCTCTFLLTGFFF